MQIIVDSLLTTYAWRGVHTSDVKNKRPVMLVLHGWGDNSRGWMAFAQSFSEQYSVLLVDLPGFGRTDTPPTAWGLDDYAHFVGAFLKKLGVRPDVVVAHSNGGSIAIRGLARGMFTTDRLVLLASAGIRGEYKGRIKAVRMVTKVGKMLITPLPQSVKKRLRHILYTRVGSDMLVAEHLQETFKRVVEDDVRADAVKIKLPVLLVYGDDDISTPPKWGSLLHEQLAYAKFELVSGAGHFVHIDKPEIVERLIKDFLTERPKKQGKV